jgi:hypothetical protein
MAFDWKNPWVLGGGALLLIILLFFRSGSSASNAGVASQSSADASNVALAGLTTQQNIAQIQANSTDLQTASATSIYDTGASASIVGMALGWLTNNNNNATAKQLSSDAVNINANNNLTATQVATIQTNGTVNAINATGTANLNLATEQDQTAIRVNGDNNALYATLSPQLAQIQADTAKSLATTSGNVATTIAGMNLNAQVAQSQIQAGAASSGATSNGLFGMLGNIFSGITAGGVKGGGSILGGLLGLGTAAAA